MGYLLAFEGWNESKCSHDGRDAVLWALRSAPSCDRMVLSEAGRSSQKLIKIEELDLLSQLKRSWSVTGLEKSSRKIRNGLVFSNSFFMVIFHRNFRAVYVFLDKDVTNNNLVDWAVTSFKEVADLRYGAAGYVSEFDSPLDAMLYALDLEILDSKAVTLDHPRKRWRDNFQLQISDRRPRDIYEVNVWDNQIANTLERRLSHSPIRSIFNHAVRLVGCNYTLAVLDQGELVHYRKSLTKAFYAGATE